MSPTVMMAFFEKAAEAVFPAISSTNAVVLDGLLKLPDIPTILINLSSFF